MSFRRSYCAALARGADALKRLAAAHRGGAKEDWAVVSAKAVAAVCAAVPPGTDNVANFGSEEQAVLSAALDALHALATDELEAQTLPWCQEVTCVTTAWGFLREACTLTERVKQQSAPWMVQQIPGILDLLVQLLIHVKGVAAHTDDLRLPRSAMTMTTNLMTMVKDIAVVNRAAGRGAAELVPVLALATEVLNLLMNGPGSFDGPAGCSCCLAAPAGASGSGAGAAAAQQPRALGNRGARPMRTEQLASGAAISDILDTINLVQGEVECGQAPGPRPLATHRATLLINLQTLAINLAEARRLTGQGRRRPGRRSAASPAVPSCADITAFLGATQDPAFFEPKLGAYWAAQPEVALLADALRISRQLEAALAPGGAPACPACTASQLLLLVEAATLCPREALRSADLRRRVLANVATLLTDSACDWTPAFQRAAVPSLAAWVAAAAQELPAGPAAAAATCHGTATYSSAAAAVLNTIHMIVDLPGSCLQAPHPALPLPQLLAATERGLRCCVADEHLHACDAGLVVIKALITHAPGSLDQLWTSGALPGLVITACKRARTSHAGSVRVATYMMAQLVDSLLAPADSRQAPWWAASAERQQFALFLLARVGGKLAEVLSDIQAGRLPLPSEPQEVCMVMSAFSDAHAATLMLGAQPQLVVLMQAGAPGLLRELMGVFNRPDNAQERDDAPVRGGVQVSVDSRGLPILAALPRQLDSLALGLRLPGCYNPACPSLAGASETDMPLKLCAGCRTARYCDAACAKAHWKHHKASCKAATAAREAGQQ